MLGKLDPATLKVCEVAMDRARQAAEKLLKRGMFRNGGNWSKTVSELLDTRRWLSHAQMISWEDAQDPLIGLVDLMHIIPKSGRTIGGYIVSNVWQSANIRSSTSQTTPRWSPVPLAPNDPLPLFRRLS